MAEQLLQIIPRIAAVKITIHDSAPVITDRDDEIIIPGKDTFRLRRGGADKVVWIRSGESGLREAFGIASRMLYGYSTILIEGNSILNHINPRLALFVADDNISSKALIKTSRLAALEKADLIIHNIRGARGQGEHCRAAERYATMGITAPVITASLRDTATVRTALKHILIEKGL
mgnify:CR=1 FL=1